GPSLQRRESLRAWAIRYARLVLGRCEGNRRETARILGISYHTLVTYLRAYDDELSGVAVAHEDHAERNEPTERVLSRVAEETPTYDSRVPVLGARPLQGNSAG